MKGRISLPKARQQTAVTARKDDVSAADQAAMANVAG